MKVKVDLCFLSWFKSENNSDCNFVVLKRSGLEAPIGKKPGVCFSTRTIWKSIISFQLRTLWIVCLWDQRRRNDMSIVSWWQVWAANTAGQLEMSFSHPEEESPADSRNVSVQVMFNKSQRIDLCNLCNICDDLSIADFTRSLSRIVVLTRGLCAFGGHSRQA